jgi:hypothetical protein
MYKLLEEQSDESHQNLLDLQSQIKLWPCNSHRRRVGANGIKRLSIYNRSKYLSWKAAQRKTFRENFPGKAASMAMVQFFQEFPPETGFLDLMNYWADMASPSFLTAFCLKGSGGLTFNDVDVAVPVKQGIVYSLNELHEIKATEEGSLWACVLTRTNPW